MQKYGEPAYASGPQEIAGTFDSEKVASTATVFHRSFAERRL